MALRLEQDFLQKLEYLQIVSRRAFAGQNRADRPAQKRGRGLEFADHRPYAAGDDFRHIDWKAYRRLNRLLLRLFDEEQDLPIYLLLDASGSMATGGKFEHARRLTAALCYVGLVHLDHVAILPFTATLGHEIRPGRGKGRIFRVLEQLDVLSAAGHTNLHTACTQFLSRPRPRGLCVVLSDFLDPGGYEPALRLLSSMGHDVLLVHVAAPEDRKCATYGEVRLIDRESGDPRDVDISPAVAEGFARAFDAHARSLEQICARYRAGYLRADAERPFEDVILQAFRQGQFLA